MNSDNDFEAHQRNTQELAHQSDVCQRLLAGLVACSDQNAVLVACVYHDDLLLAG